MSKTFSSKIKRRQNDGGGGFSSGLLKRQNQDLRVMNAIEKGRDCWFIIKVDPLKYIEYKAALKFESINIQDYAEILESGWGKEPPEATLAAWKKKLAA